MKINKSEKILIGIVLLMAGFIVSYNLFFETPFNPINFSKEDIILQSDSEQNFAEEKYDYLVNINTSSAEELAEKLNGIGPALAKRIIEYRESNGGFSDISEIKNIKGIGEKLFTRISDKIKI
ncbi:MAG: helix-hairpin-helix domain-containing protein [Oscillospiraceae bacterium]|jgi:competence protein ComEA|nr:helix-hairpin-helix domain-containing protein [Oscillospiraceae bacterium]